MKVEHELKLNCTEMSMIRCMCGIKLNKRKKSEELRELLGLEPVSLMMKNNRSRWFGHVERNNNNNNNNNNVLVGTEKKIITTTIYIVLSSRTGHCESSLGSSGECRAAPSGRPPSDQAT